MGSTPSKRATHAPRLIEVASEEKKEWLMGYRNPNGPIYVLMRDEVVTGDEFTTAQKQKLRFLEPIGQVRIGPNRNWKSVGDPANLHTYTWPMPTGDLAPLAEKAIWECTEFSTTVHETRHTLHSLNYRPYPLMVLPVGSAFTIQYAMTHARPSGFTMGKGNWEILTKRIRAELVKGTKWYEWFETLTPYDQIRFGSTKRTAWAMTNHIIAVLEAAPRK
jgi:hypothetical protein